MPRRADWRSACAASHPSLGKWGRGEVGTTRSAPPDTASSPPVVMSRQLRRFYVIIRIPGSRGGLYPDIRSRSGGGATAPCRLTRIAIRPEWRPRGRCRSRRISADPLQYPGAEEICFLPPAPHRSGWPPATPSTRLAYTSSPPTGARVLSLRTFACSSPGKSSADTGGSAKPPVSACSGADTPPFSIQTAGNPATTVPPALKPARARWASANCCVS